MMKSKRANLSDWVNLVVAILALVLAWSVVYAPALSAAGRTGQLHKNPGVPSGRLAFVAVDSGNWDLWTVDADGTDPVRLTNTAIDERYPCWSPDGTRIACSTSDGNIWVIDAHSGTNPQQFKLETWNAGQPAWSPDGASIAFTGFSDPKVDDSDIWVIHADGTDLIHIVPQREIQMYAAWHPGGRRLIYSSAVYGPSYEIIQDLWTIELSDRSAARILVNDAANIQAEWSPDGNWIAFASDKTGDWEVWVMDSNGQNLRQITQNPAYDADPTWSPDGKSLAFVSNRMGSLQIWVVDIDGKNPRMVTDMLGGCTDPAWRR
ncbi:MAG: hypothetical protein V1694_07110 [Candidatus Eisenbacteria bacterium]